MRIAEIIWIDAIIEKLAVKHGVRTAEVEEVLDHRPRFFFGQKGERPGEDLYVALGPTYEGRLLVVFFIYKANQDALILSAREMDASERRRYGRK